MNLPRVLCFLLALTATTPALAGREFLELSPNTASPGTEVLARGSGFDPGTSVQLTLLGTPEPVPLDDVEVLRNGTFLGRVPVPRVAAGSYQIGVTDGARGVLASAPLEITGGTSLTLVPDSGAPGESITVMLDTLPAGSVEVRYDGLTVVGPVPHRGGAFERQFLVPADRPDPLGETATVTATVRMGRIIVAQATASFTSIAPDTTPVRVMNLQGPAQPLRRGQAFSVTGRLEIPARANLSDYRLFLVRIKDGGTLIPINHAPAVIEPDGTFEMFALTPSVLSGLGHQIDDVDEYGVGYENVRTKTNGLLGQIPIEYTALDVQQLTILVTDNFGNPLQDALVVIDTNAFAVPPDYDPDQDGIFNFNKNGAIRPKPTWPALYSPPNQFQAGFIDAATANGALGLTVAGCPITLVQGQTDSNGEFSINVLPFMNEMLDQTAQQVGTVAEGTPPESGPGAATFAIKVNAIHLGHANTNPEGNCTGQRFDIRYDYTQSQWLKRSSSDGDFETEFDPDQTLDVEIGICIGDVAFPGSPYMPGTAEANVPVLSGSLTRLKGLQSFPDTNGANLVIESPPQLRLPHLDTLFGAPSNVRLALNGQDMGPMAVDGALCGDGIEYRMDLPGLVTAPPQLMQGLITGEAGERILEKPFQIEIKQGPGWITDSQSYETRSIFWKPGDVRLYAEEPVRARDASVDNVPQDVGDLDNDNLTSGAVSQRIGIAGSSRSRMGMSNATAANQTGEPAPADTKATLGAAVTIGEDEVKTIVDTGNIPLFRYAWGIPPIASATLGADIWFKAFYYYFGSLVYADAQVLASFTAAASMSAGLDLFFDASLILGLVEADAHALPAIGLAMPLVIDNNQFIEEESQPCFKFLLDVMYQVKTGACPVCLEVGGEARLIDETEPANCGAPGFKQVDKGRSQPPSLGRPAITTNDMGDSLVAWADDSGSIKVQSYLYGTLEENYSFTAAAGTTSLDIVFFAADKAIKVWAQSSLPDEEFLALGDPLLATPYQHLAYRVLTDGVWSDPMMLTSPTTGDGNVVLATCHDSDVNCPAGGEVLAVWVRDLAGDIAQHDTRLFYAFFDGTAWSAPAEVDPGSSDTALQPAATYARGEPVVAWVRNAAIDRSGRYPDLNLHDRELAYRFLRQPAGAMLATTLFPGIASPSLASYTDGSLALAYTVATDNDSFLGTRRSLHTARGRNCDAGICTFNSVERRDSKGRRIYAEGPKILVDQDNYSRVLFRQLGTDFPLPRDPIGVTTHTGDLAQIGFDGDTIITDPSPMSVDGAVNWKIDGAIDAATGALLVTSVAGTPVAGDVLKAARQPARHAWGTTRFRLDSDKGGIGGVMLTQQPLLPDFQVLDVEPSAQWIADGATISLSVGVRNNGEPWEEFEDVVVAAYWDGPPGVGVEAASVGISYLGDAQTLDLSIALAPGAFPDEARDLHVVANPGGALNESDAGNNSRVITLGQLPPPENLRVTSDRASGVIIIHWDAVTDPRVASYRVYRSDADGTTVAIGSSEVAGYADFSAGSGQMYQYTVTSLSERMMESGPSAPVVAGTEDPVLLFRNGFEP